MNLEAAILARVSDDQGGRSKSVPEQIAEGQAAARALGWHAAREFSDEDMSASSYATKERPGWQALRAAVEAGFVRGVIVWAVNRASREVEDWAGFLNICRRRQVMIHVVVDKRTYDCTVAHDLKTLLSEGIDGWYESERKSIDVRRGVAGAKAAGKPNSSLPWGYKKVRDPDNGRLLNWEVVESQAEQVREIFRLLADGESVCETARKTGTYRQRVLNIARRPAYISRQRLDDGTLAECVWPPIVDEGLFWRVQRILDAHRGAGSRPGAYRSLLAYLAVCGGCGGTVITSDLKRGGEKARHYRCQLHGCVVLAEDKADDAVMFEAADYLIQPGVLERYLPRDDGTEAARAQAEAARLRAELDSWMEAGVSAAAYKKKEDALLPRIEAAEVRARSTLTPAQVAFEMFAKRLHPVTGQEYEVATSSRLNLALKVWDELPLLAARDVVKTTLQVVLWPKKIAIDKGVEYNQTTVTWREDDESDGLELPENASDQGDPTLTPTVTERYRAVQ
jgi:DNA invertase Pin-like site-specific DNA recombinase